MKSGIKITRPRRRLYESDDQSVPQASVQPSPDVSLEPDVFLEQAAALMDDANGREAAAVLLVKKNMSWSMGLGLVPLPLLDLAALTALQVKMVRDIATLYHRPNHNELRKSVIASLIGSANVYSLGGISWRSLIKIFPGAGLLIGAASFSLFSAASTFAVGKVFIQHFEMGGTLLDFNPTKVKSFYREQFQQGLKKAPQSES